MGSEVAESDGGSAGGEETRPNTAARAYAIAGLSYPLWSFVGDGPVDPPAAWWGIGGLFLIFSLGAVRWRARPVTESRLTPVLASISSLHFFLLASLNDMMPFYAVGSTMSVLVAVMVLRSPKAILVYCGFVAALGSFLYAYDPHVLKLAYWLGPLPTAALAYRRLTMQLDLEHRLEDQVSERTRQLTDTNQRLRDEIAARSRLEEQLRSREKAEAVGRLAGGVAHDFNNLLTTIGVYADLLEEALPGGSPLREEVERIKRAQLQATSLTQQLLTLGRRSHVPTDVLDLNQVLSGLRSLLRHLLGDHQLHLSLCDAPVLIRANLEQLQQIVINLVLNARDAMPEPGRMTIETALCDGVRLAAERLGVDATSGRYALLAARDTGTGMDRETRERAFDPFFSTKGPGRGSGLGLSTVHGIVSQAGGHVRLTSEPGCGASFELYWPLAAHEVARIAAPVAAGRDPRRASILVVEDEESVRAALYRVLTNAGHEVIAACDGEQALALASDPRAACDLVITDVVMPQMSGLELAERLAETRPEVRVILISGHLNDRAMQDWDERFPFLAKPFAPGDLMRKVREVLAPAAAPV